MLGEGPCAGTGRSEDAAWLCCIPACWGRDAQAGAATPAFPQHQARGTGDKGVAAGQGVALGQDCPKVKALPQKTTTSPKITLQEARPSPWSARSQHKATTPPTMEAHSRG